MRVHIIGDNPTAIALRGLLSKTGRYALTPKATATAIIVTIREAGREVVIDGVDSPLEARMVSRIAELLKDGRVVLQRGGSNQNDRAVVISLPANDHETSDAVERGVLRALDQIQRVKLPTTVIGGPMRRLAAMFSWLWVVLFIVVLPTSGFAQGVVSQGASNSGISPWYVRFVAVQHFICDSGCGSPPATADKTVFVFGTTNVSPAGFVVDDVATDTVAENSYGAARMTTNREMLAYISNIPHFICDSGCGSASAVLMSDATANPTIPQTAAFGMGYNGTTWDRLRATTANGLAVDVTRVTGSVTVTDGAGALNVIVDSGTVTANAGTNLNTSLLALEAGGNLATATASLSVLDDWDETDRAKVNPIAGQAGVQGASGTVTALTQRMVLATDVALPAGTNLLGKVGIDQTTPGTTNRVDVGVFPDNEPFNVAQINGVTPLMGNGATGTGSLRVTIADNNTPVPTKLSQTTTDNDVDVVSDIPGTGATNLGKAEDAVAASADTGVFVLGVADATNATQRAAARDYTQITTDEYGTILTRGDHPNRLRCTQTVSTAVILTLVPGCAAPGAGLSIYITSVSFSTNVAAIAADSFPTLKYGTGGACGTGTTVFWGAFTIAATALQPIFESFPVPIKIPANNEVCWINTGAGSRFVNVLGFIAP